MSWQNSFHGFSYQTTGNIVLQLGGLCEVLRCLLGRGLRHHCPVYNVSCIFYLFNKCLYFSYGVAGYSLDRPPMVIKKMYIHSTTKKYILSSYSDLQALSCACYKNINKTKNGEQKFTFLVRWQAHETLRDNSKVHLQQQAKNTCQMLNWVEIILPAHLLN